MRRIHPAPRPFRVLRRAPARTALPGVGRALIVLLVLMIVLPLTVAAREAGHLGVYFDANASNDVQDVGSFTEFELFVIADFRNSRGPSGKDLQAWEARIDVDPRVVVVGRELHPTAAINFADTGSPDDYRVGTGSPLSTIGAPIKLATYRCMVMATEVHDARVWVADTDFEGRGPGWLALPPGAGDEELVLFDSWGGALINPKDGIDSWGGIKSNYDDF